MRTTPSPRDRLFQPSAHRDREPARLLSYRLRARLGSRVLNHRGANVPVARPSMHRPSFGRWAASRRIRATWSSAGSRFGSTGCFSRTAMRSSMKSRLPARRARQRPTLDVVHFLGRQVAFRPFVRVEVLFADDPCPLHPLGHGPTDHHRPIDLSPRGRRLADRIRWDRDLKAHDPIVFVYNLHHAPVLAVFRRPVKSRSDRVGAYHFSSPSYCPYSITVTITSAARWRSHHGRRQQVTALVKVIHGQQNRAAARKQAIKAATTRTPDAKLAWNRAKRFREYDDRTAASARRRASPRRNIRPSRRCASL